MLLLLLLINPGSGCEIMSEEEGPGSGPQPYDSMDWMNNFITASGMVSVNAGGSGLVCLRDKAPGTAPVP